MNIIFWFSLIYGGCSLFFMHQYVDSNISYSSYLTDYQTQALLLQAYNHPPMNIWIFYFSKLFFSMLLSSGLVTCMYVYDISIIVFGLLLLIYFFVSNVHIYKLCDTFHSPINLFVELLHYLSFYAMMPLLLIITIVLFCLYPVLIVYTIGYFLLNLLTYGIRYMLGAKTAFGEWQIEKLVLFTLLYMLNIFIFINPLDILTMGKQIAVLTVLFYPFLIYNTTMTKVGDRYKAIEMLRPFLKGGDIYHKLLFLASFFYNRNALVQQCYNLGYGEVDPNTFIDVLYQPYKPKLNRFRKVHPE